MFGVAVELEKRQSGRRWSSSCRYATVSEHGDRPLLLVSVESMRVVHRDTSWRFGGVGPILVNTHCGFNN